MVESPGKCVAAMQLVNVVTPQEHGVCGESNEIHVNGEKNCFVFNC